MKEFIKIKNADGSGEMLLRTALVLSVTDGDVDLAGEVGTVVKYRDESDGSYWQYRTASTAAEVLEAIEERGVPTGLVFKSCTCAGTLGSDPDCALHGRHGPLGPYYSYWNAGGEVVHPLAFKKEQSMPSDPLLPDCRCSYRPGDNLNCPLHCGIP